MLKISHLEQLNSKVFALLSTLFSRLKIDHLIKQIGISRQRESAFWFWLRIGRISRHNAQTSSHQVPEYGN